MMKSFKHRDPFAEGRAHRPEGEGEEIRYSFGQSSLGWVLVAASDKGIASISIGEARESLIEGLQEEFPLAHLVRENGTLDDMVPRVIEFINEPVGEFDLPLDMRGTDFQKRVWRAVQKIPVGQTSTYSEIASIIGSPKAIRAVGSSCAKSKFSMVVPCHRVLSKGGSSGRDDSGGERRRMSIEREVGMGKHGPSTRAKRKQKGRLD